MVILATVFFFSVRSKCLIEAWLRKLSTSFPREYSEQYSGLVGVGLFFCFVLCCVVLVLSQCPLVQDLLEHDEKTDVSSVMSFLGPSLTNAARPFSEDVAVKPSGRTSHLLVGAERERTPTG